MKVVLDGRPSLGGIHRYTSELSKVLSTVLGRRELHIFGQRPGLGQRVGPAGTGRAWPVISGLRQFSNDQVFLPIACRLNSAQLYHSPHAFLPKRMSVSTVVTCHDLWLIDEFSTKPLGLKKYYELWNLKLALRNADQIVTLSHSVADKLKAKYGIDSQRISCIPPPLPGLHPNPKSAVPAKPFLLTVGTLEPRKNLKRLLEAQMLAFLKTGVPLYLIGPYGWRAKPILAQLARMGPAAKWLGHVEDAVLAGFYQRASALVQYSLDEGFDYPVAEALCFGCPLVLSEIPVHLELAGDLGLFASPFNPSQLVHCLQEVLTWSRLRREEHAAHAAKAIEKLKKEGRPERYLTVYKKALGLFD